MKIFRRFSENGMLIDKRSCFTEVIFLTCLFLWFDQMLRNLQQGSKELNMSHSAENWCKNSGIRSTNVLVQRITMVLTGTELCFLWEEVIFNNIMLWQQIWHKTKLKTLLMFIRIICYLRIYFETIFFLWMIFTKISR